jgi:hypothetical protein
MDEDGPGIAALIGLEPHELMQFCSRIETQPLVLALTRLPKFDLEWFVSHFNRRAALLLLDDVEASRDQAPERIREAQRTIDGLIRQLVAEGVLPARLVAGKS